MDSRDPGFGLSPSYIDSLPIGKAIFFGIGIDEYDHFENLGNAVKDIEDVSNILFNDYQFEKKHSIFLIDENATKQNIYSSFRDLIQIANHNDSILIYFSGHGAYDEVTDQGYWVPVDAMHGMYDTYIENAAILTFITAMKARHVSIFSNAIFYHKLLLTR